MKLSLALVSLLSVVLASPVPASKGGYNADGSSRISRAVQDIAGSSPDDFDRLLSVPEPVGPGLNPLLGGARLSGVLNGRDADFAPIGDVSAIIEPEVEILRARDGGLGASANNGPLGDSISKSVLPSADEAGAWDVSFASHSTQLNTAHLDDLSRTVRPVSSDTGVSENDDPVGGLPSKRDLSPAEIMANARKTLSAAERDYEKYPNEITRDAYNNAVAAVRALTESGN
ncbi:hypothetical protein V501_07537 [Pseudogymnoascus sp. VKM F-4519 (FW-2642)]|nr:hypothetical protein V501_07537 [Pseudogymnoascus sp. VKM F-4519 (FW-2642)]